MTILITGNLGYIGSVLGNYLSSYGFKVMGLDSGFFQKNTVDVCRDIKTNIKDIRDIIPKDLIGVESIVHLAGLSNDPLGEFDKSLTFEINYEATINLAKMAKASGIKKFVFMSSQSIYGYSDIDEPLDEDCSVKNPQTAYAESKWLAEKEIFLLDSSTFSVVALRPSTVFGWSPRLRTDIVFNNLLTTGFFSKQINVHSDGLPWRPIIHIMDVCKAIKMVLESNLSRVSLNLGIIGGNFQVSELATIASKSLNDIPVIFNTENITDSRSYKVDFKKAKDLLGFQANITLETGAREIIKKLIDLKIDSEIFFKKTNRLTSLKQLLIDKSLKNDLRFN